MVRIDKDYVFEGPEGRGSLLELFEARRQLILYRFMFAPGVDSTLILLRHAVDATSDIFATE